jgi:type II secretory pathway pseudopilin PulG
MIEVKSQERRAKCPTRMFALRSFSGSRLSTLSPRPRRGITLLELLITILIISILAALILGVAAVAGETARQHQTAHTIERLHTLLVDYYNTLKTRRVRLNSGVEAAINNPTNIPNASDRSAALAEARLYARREMVLMEIPDRWSDVLLASVVASDKANVNPLTPLYFAEPSSTTGRTALANVYLRRYLALAAAVNNVSDMKKRQEALGALVANQSAECLYMVITLATGDGEARGQFGESTIGDTDGDGAPEFLDGWGHPINFLRWAPGFDSQIQLNQNEIDTMVSGTQTAEAQRLIARDHDPFDMYRRDGHAFRLVPLIYSSGKDEISGIYDAPDYVTWRKGAFGTPARQQPYLKPWLTPYEFDSSLSAYLGTSTGEGTADNVHNHLMGLR